MSGPQYPPSEDDWGGSEGDEWRQPQQPPPDQPAAPQQPPPGYQAPAPPPPGYGGQPPPYGAQPVYGGPPPQNIPNYLVHSILATVLCCLPTGIVGIVYASQVNSKLASGDVAGAQKASRNARLWSIISVGAGIVFGIIYLLIVVASNSSSGA